MSGYEDNRMNRLDRLRARLARDNEGRWVAGVCAGIARHLRIDPAFIRAGVVIVAIFAWQVVLAAYVAAWILLPVRAP